MLHEQFNTTLYNLSLLKEQARVLHSHPSLPVLGTEHDGDVVHLVGRVFDEADSTRETCLQGTGSHIPVRDTP